MRLTPETCGCMSLRTGTLIVGYINVVLGVILKIGWGGLAVYTVKNMANKDAIPVVALIYVIIICLYLIHLVLSILLVCGVHDGRPERKEKRIKPFLIYAVILITLHFVGICVTSDKIDSYGLQMNAFTLFGIYFVVMTVFLGVSIYTAFSYYRIINRPTVSPPERSELIAQTNPGGIIQPQSRMQRTY